MYLINQPTSIMSEEVFWIYITAKDIDEARTIGRTVVQERLAACANIAAGIESFYWWDGALQHENEVMLIVKSTRSLLTALIDRIRNLHSYDCPCIEVLPVIGGNPDYLQWIQEETRPRS